MQKSQMLKVCGILMIIGGAIGIVLSLVAVVGALALLAWLGAYALVLTLACILSLAAYAMELATGIVGVKNCDKPEKVASCVKTCVVTIVLILASIVLTIIAGGSVGFLDVLLGLVLPVLYLIGANQLKAAPQNPAE